MGNSILFSETMRATAAKSQAIGQDARERESVIGPKHLRGKDSPPFRSEK